MPINERNAAFADNLALLAAYRAGDAKAGDAFVRKNRPLVLSLANRFCGRCDLSDLVEVGDIGLSRAMQTFDASRGVAFSTYAVPLILGEMRRFLRDGGPLHVFRTERLLSQKLSAERDRRAAHGESTAVADIAAACGVSPADAAAVLGASYEVRSLDEPIFGEDGKVPLGTLLPAEEGLSPTEKLALGVALESLPDFWKKIVGLRFFRDLSQEKTAACLGVSQVKISREEKKILSFLKEKLA